MSDDVRAAGIAKMEEVYGFSVDPDTVPGRYVDLTVDQLFGTVWTNDDLSLRDRRLNPSVVRAEQHGAAEQPGQ